MKVIIAAAGTAGHINPGLAIANKIKKEEPDSKIIFIGTTRGLENDLVPRAGYELKTIHAYGLSKKISIENLKQLYKTYKGIGEANKIIKDFKPDIVIGTGGYICGPVVMASSKNKIPVVIHESNAFPGKATKMLSKKSEAILISFDDAKKRLPDAKRVVHTGTPIKIAKKDYTINEKNAIINKLGLSPVKPIVLIFGGSQGAQRINEALLSIIKNNQNKDYQIVWATGPKQYDNIKEDLERARININNIENTKIIPYIYNMEEIMNISDVIVARSGAMTIAEISALGKPSILIPLPNVSGNHQLYNAKVLEDAGAAKIILNDKLEGSILNKTIEEIILNKTKLKQMGESAKTKATYDVENKIYEEIKNAIKSKS